MDPESPASDSALSDLNSDEVESVNINTRSRSNSAMSASSALSSAAASPRQDMPPAKRRKTGATAHDHATPQSGSTAVPPRSPTGSISSDSSGSVPNSPSFQTLGPTHPLSTFAAAAQANPENPDHADYIQVTRCQWEDCSTPEQGNMDNLVQHLNDVHIVPRQKKFYCQWAGCNRKGQPHTSAYALKAHLRSHTKEKPFYCVLPECDRSFTRSDALAKHMRTVHETEALRPSDPIPRGHSGGILNGNTTNGGVKRIKLIMGGGANGEKRVSVIGELPPLPTKHTVAQTGIKLEDVDMKTTEDELEELADAVDMDSVPFTMPPLAEYWPADIWDDMEDYERVLPPSQYFRLLRRQIMWAEQEDDELKKVLNKLRSTAEDAYANLLTRGVGDEEGGDKNKLFEWQQTEHILDEVLRAQVGKAREAITGEPALGGENPWESIKGLDGLVRAQMQEEGA